MDKEHISLLAQLIEKYGIFRVVLAMVLSGIAVSFPIFVSFLKDAVKRKSEKALIAKMDTIADDIRSISSQYSDSLSKQMVEILLERIYKHEYWILYDFCRDIIEKNDVENDVEGINTSVKMQVKVCFKAISNDLDKFKYRNRNISYFLACGAWETEIFNTLDRVIFEKRSITKEKRVNNLKLFISTEFENIHFLTMQNINNF